MPHLGHHDFSVAHAVLIDFMCRSKYSALQLFHKADPSIKSLGTQKMQNMQLKAISEQFNLNHQTKIFLPPMFCFNCHNFL